MAVRTQDYVQQIKALLPYGLAWNREDVASSFALMIECWAAEFARIDARVGQLLEEADPRFCTETFKEWLIQWGVPDPCLELWGALTAAGLVPDVLRTALVQKISEPGGNSLGFFTRLAKGYGYDITIFDRTHSFHVMSYITDPIEAKVPPHNWYVFVYEGGGKVTWHKTTGTAKEPIAWWGDKVIECLLRRYCPAHTDLHIAYAE